MKRTKKNKIIEFLKKWNNDEIDLTMKLEQDFSKEKLERHDDAQDYEQKNCLCSSCEIPVFEYPEPSNAYKYLYLNHPNRRQLAESEDRDMFGK